VETIIQKGGVAIMASAGVRGFRRGMRFLAEWASAVVEA
jgi:hypothetical protein